ncbi:hypothetical protein AHAS_Ahas18G0170100 [Arachis hypogaea]
MDECTITPKDVAHIYGLLADGCAVNRRTNNSFTHLVDEYVANFEIFSGKNDHVFSTIKMSWIRQIRDAKALVTPESVQQNTDWIQHHSN